MNKVNRIQHMFSQGKVFIAYLTSGDGGMARTLESALALIEAGVHMLEIGVPFSDPIADGPIIQRAAARAIQCGTTMSDVLWLAKEIRKRSDVPLILFSYLNPILSALRTSFSDEGGFFSALKQAGIDGLLIVDCPFEEAQMIHQQCMHADIAPIYVLSPATPLDRVQAIHQYAKGFLYYACRKGTTGLRNDLPLDFVEKITAIKSVVTLPVVVGFGVSERSQSEQILKYAEGVVVGSLFVKALEEGISPQGLQGLVNKINPL